jgi:hypothetical protein
METVGVNKVVEVEVMLDGLVAYGRLPKDKAKADQRPQALLCFTPECCNVVDHLLVNNISIRASVK